MAYTKWLKRIIWAVAGLVLAATLALFALTWPHFIPKAFVLIKNSTKNPIEVTRLQYASKTMASDLTLDGGEFSNIFCAGTWPKVDIDIVFKRPGESKVKSHNFTMRKDLLTDCYWEITIQQSGIDISECIFFEGIDPFDCF